jgi:hypothetical protein
LAAPFPGDSKLSRVSKDRGEQVVEVVRDPAGEHAESFELLGLREVQREL